MKTLMTFAIILILASTGFSQFRNDTYIWSFDMGQALIQADESGESLDSYGGSIAFHKSDITKPFALGAYFGYIYADENGDSDNILQKVYYRTIPVIFEGQFLFGSPKIKGNLTAGLGLQFSEVSYYLENNLLVDYDAGFAFDVGAGGMLFISNTVAVNLGYKLFLLQNQQYEGGLAHLITLGLSLQTK